MPMQVTVSRNRKTSHNCNSEGFGVSMAVELDQALLGRRTDLQRQLDALYHEADEALERQASGQPTAGSTRTANGRQTGAPTRSAPRGNGIGHDRTSHSGAGQTSGGTSGAGPTCPGRNSTPSGGVPVPSRSSTSRTSNRRSSLRPWSSAVPFTVRSSSSTSRRWRAPRSATPT